MQPAIGIALFVNAGEGDQIFVVKMSSCKKNTYADITASSCSKYTLNGQVYDSTGVYMQTLTNVASCDSFITLSLTIKIPEAIYNETTCRNFS
jgi:hypothetical protein